MKSSQEPSDATPRGTALLERTYNNVMCPPGVLRPHLGLFAETAKTIGVPADEFAMWANGKEWSDTRE